MQMGLPGDLGTDDDAGGCSCRCNGKGCPRPRGRPAEVRDPQVVSLPSALGSQAVETLGLLRAGWVDAAVEPGQRRLKVEITGNVKRK